MTDLTFISISHPDDIRTAENKTKIARMAMINRPGKTKATRAQIQPQTRSAVARPPVNREGHRAPATANRQRIPSTAASYAPSRARNSQVTSPDEFNNGAISPPNIYSPSDLSSPPGLSHNGASPDSTGISPPHLAQVNSNEFATFEQYSQTGHNGYFENVDYSNPQFSRNARYPQYESAAAIVSPPSDEDLHARNYAAVTSAKSIDSGAIQRKREEQSNAVTTVAKPRRVNKKTLARRQLLNDPTDQETHVDPMAQLIGALLDPFNSMPMGANRHTQELLYQYVGAYLMSPQLGGPGSLVHKRLTASRKNLWWPMVQQSKAALAALIVYVETTPGLPNKSPSEEYLMLHQSIALKAIGESISDSANGDKQAADDAICFAIVLLMIAAQRTHDKEATRSHANGLKIVLAKRAEAFERNRTLESTTLEKGTRISGPVNPRDLTLKCQYCKINASKEPRSRESSPDIPDVTYTVSPDKVGSGFTTLVDEGELSYSMQAFVETSLQWNIVAQQARRDRLSAACGASHAWTDGNSEIVASTPLDNAVMYSVRIALYLSAWLDWNHECDAVKKMVFAVNMSLKKLESNPERIDHLLLQYPEVILWATLLVGPYTEEMNTKPGDAPSPEENTLRYFMLKLAGRASECVKLKRRMQQGPDVAVSFDDILVDISNKYLWTSTMTPAAKAFYHDGDTLWQTLQSRRSNTLSALDQYAQQLTTMAERREERDVVSNMNHNTYSNALIGHDTTTSADTILSMDDFGHYQELLNPNLNMRLQDDFHDYDMVMNNLGMNNLVSFDEASMTMPVDMVGAFDEATMTMPLDGYITDEMMMAMGNNVQDMSIYDQTNFGQEGFVWIPEQNEMDNMAFMAMNDQYYGQNGHQL